MPELRLTKDDLSLIIHALRHDWSRAQPQNIQLADRLLEVRRKIEVALVPTLIEAAPGSKVTFITAPPTPPGKVYFSPPSAGTITSVSVYDASDRTPAQRYVAGLNAIEDARPGGRYQSFEAVVGKRWTKIVKNGGVHAFVDTATGEVYKAESHSKPAKGVRFATVEDALAAAGVDPLNAFTGAYLYRR